MVLSPELNKSPKNKLIYLQDGLTVHDITIMHKNSTFIEQGD